MAKTTLSSLISSTTKQKLIPAIVVDVLGKRCSIKLGGSGKIIHNLPFVGPAPVAGDAVKVNFLGRKPTVEIASQTAQNYSTVTNSLVATKQSIPAPLEAQTTHHNDHNGLEGGREAADGVTAEYYHLTEDQYADVEAIDALSQMNGFLRKTANNEWVLDFMIPEGYNLQVGNPAYGVGTTSYIGIGEIGLQGAYLRIGETSYQAIQMSIYRQYAPVLIAGWNESGMNIETLFGDIEAEDHGNYLNIKETGAEFNCDLNATNLTGTNTGDHKWLKTVAPTVNDDAGEGYEKLDTWIDQTNEKAYICISNAYGNANWLEIGSGGGGGSIVFAVNGALSVADNIPNAYIFTADATIEQWYVYLKNAGSSGSTIVNIILNGITSIFLDDYYDNRPEVFAYDELSGYTIGNPIITNFVAGDVLTFDIDQVAAGALDIVCVGGTVGGGASSAADVTYIPIDATDWTGGADPGNTDDALDQLAARMTDHDHAKVQHAQAVFSIEGALDTVETKPLRIYTPYVGDGATIEEVLIAVSVAPTTTALRIDVNKNGSSIFSTPYVEMATGNYTATKSTGFADDTLAKDDYLTIEVAQGDVAAQNLTVHVRYTWTLTGV